MKLLHALRMNTIIEIEKEFVDIEVLIRMVYLQNEFEIGIKSYVAKTEATIITNNEQKYNNL